MGNYYPPIKDRDTEVLIYIAFTDRDSWQADAVKQAENELLKRGISEGEQKGIISNIAKLKDERAKEYQKQLEINKTEPYRFIEKIAIFFLSPLILVGKVNFGHSLSMLKEENFKRKYKHRFILLIGGVLFWIFVFRIIVVR